MMQRILDLWMIIICEGGMWVWPGVRMGYKQKVDLFVPIEPGAREQMVNQIISMIYSACRVVSDKAGNRVSSLPELAG